MRQVNIKVIDTEEFNSGINKKIVNNLNAKEEGYLLDASQGKVLDEKKVDKNNISNSLSVEEEGYVLDARQGKILEDKIQKVIGDIDVINGTGEGSISKYVNDAITNLIAEAPESFDTLKEISNWISTHSDSASAMNTSISQLQSDLASHTHLYAGSSSAGGAATSANKLNTNAGSALNPVYFSDGIPKACTYSLNKTVPSDAVFTDTKNTAGSTDTSSKIFLIGATSQAANPQTYSHNTAYVGTDGCLYSNSTKVSVEGHTHSYAGSSSAGGAATSANKLNTNAGSTTQPVYFADGIPKACTYTLGKSVPSNAVFTDTTYIVDIAMTGLGFTKGSTYTILEFFTKLTEKGYSGKMQIKFRYDNNSTAKISDGTTTIDMNGATCYLSIYSTGTWRKDYAIVSIGTKVYLLYALYDGSSTPSTQSIVDVTANTKNTAGSTDSSSKLFLIGATSQAANPQTYSHNTAYVGADGCLYSNSTKVSVEGHTHNYAGSSSVGGAATSANKINTNAGSATQPVYFANGIPVKCTYTLGKSVPSNAVFTDTNTTYSAGTGLTLSSTTFSAKIANNLTTTTAGYALDATQGKQLLTYMNGIYGNYGTELHTMKTITTTAQTVTLTANLTDYKILEFDVYLTDSPLYSETFRVSRNLFTDNGGKILNLAGGSDYIFGLAEYVSSTQIKYYIIGISGPWDNVVSTKMSVRLRGLK